MARFIGGFALALLLAIPFAITWAITGDFNKAADSFGIFIAYLLFVVAVGKFLGLRDRSSSTDSGDSVSRLIPPEPGKHIDENLKQFYSDNSSGMRDFSGDRRPNGSDSSS